VLDSKNTRKTDASSRHRLPKTPVTAGDTCDARGILDDEEGRQVALTPCFRKHAKNAVTRF
jgi:hypothetical protein